jgi:hypothetical protein
MLRVVAGEVAASGRQPRNGGSAAAARRVGAGRMGKSPEMAAVGAETLEVYPLVGVYLEPALPTQQRVLAPRTPRRERGHEQAHPRMASTLRDALWCWVYPQTLHPLSTSVA